MSRRRKIVVGSVGLLAVVLVVLVAARVMRPAPPVVEYAALVIAAGSEQQGSDVTGSSGWDRFLEACDAADVALAAFGDRETLDATGWQSATWSDAPGEAIEIAAAISAAFEQAGVFAMLDEALAADRMVRESYDDDSMPLTDAPEPELGTARVLTRMLQFRMHTSAINGDAAEYSRALDQMLGLGGRLSTQGGAFDHMVGHETIARAMREVRTLTLEDRLDAAMLRATASSLERVPAAAPEAVLERQRLWVLHGVQSMHRKGRDGMGVVSGISTLIGGPIATQQRSERLCNEIFDAAVTEAGRSLAERRASPVDLDPIVRQSDDDLFLKLLMPSVLKSIRSSDRFQTAMEATRLVVELARVRHERGAYPATLEMFSPSWSAVGLAPFVYRVDGEEYALYSVGADGVDNGGVRPRGDPMNALTPAIPDVDWVFTVERTPFGGW